MQTTFSYNSQIKDLQNSVISQNIRDVSNLELLNSEEAIRNVIKSYTSKFNAVGGMLTDISKFIVQSKEVIKVKDFNDLFESIYIDLYALYNELNNVNKVLDLNLQRNKNYFLIMKKRIRDLWNKLNLTRSYIYDANPADESFYEAFYTDINASIIQEVLVDKKSGYLFIKPVSTEIHNKSFQIKNIGCVTYPEPNDNGGVFTTTNILNTFDDNYINGPRDMLQNGLWKEEIYSSIIPNLIINIGSDEVPIKRNYKGIVSVIDIEYTYNVDFNRIDFDVFGDKPILIDAILYKQDIDDNWRVLNFENEDPLLTSEESYDITKYSVRGTGFDIINFYNIEKVSAKFLRIVVNQENYTHMTFNSIEAISVESKINKDLSERRYELIKFNKNIDSFLSNPKNDENKSLYNKIIDIIDSTSSIEKILHEIEDLLIPKTNIVEMNFSTVLKYEVGLWSIEPKLELYTHNNGIFDSKSYKIQDRSMISVSLNSKQFNPGATTCNWYATINNKNIPIIENSSPYRKEPISIFNANEYSNFSGWVDGSFVLLDFPININTADTISMYTNGVYTDNVYSKIAFLNSRLLFLDKVLDIKRSNLVVRYPVSLYSTVNLYVLTPKPSVNVVNNLISLGIVSTKKEILNAFINDVKYNDLTIENTGRYLKDDFTVTNAIATIEESKYWFGNEFNFCLFVAYPLLFTLDKNSLSKYNNALKVGDSKISTKYSDVYNYFIGQTQGLSDLNILGGINNIAPLPNIKEI